MDVRTIQSDGSARGLAGSISPTPGLPGGQNGETGALAGIGKNDFLKLLVAQLRNQDPMKPMEDQEFIAQMAQLNTVEQLTAMNTKLSEFLESETLSQASALLGKMIVAEPSGANPITGVVQEVRIEQGRPVLNVAGQEVPLADVTKIAPAT